MKQTSLLAWQSVSVTLSKRQAEVLTALREVGGRATMHKIALHLGRPLYSISGRFSELEKKGYIQPIEIEKQDGYHPRTVYQANCFVEPDDVYHLLTSNFGRATKQAGGGVA